MRIVFFGTPDFAVPALEALIRADYEIVMVVTQPDRKKGRGDKLAMSPVKECAIAHALPVFQPEKVREKEALQRIRETEPDIGVVAAFGQIFPTELLEMPRFGCVNIHASLLPRHRGASPIQQAILDGDSETGVTLQQMADGVDTGDILLQKKIPIGAEDTGGSMFDRLAALGAELITEALPMIEEGRITPVRQDETAATHCKKITKELGMIDWNMPAAVIERRVRALDPWPGSFRTLKNGRLLKIWKVGCAPSVTDQKGGEEPGTIIHVDKDSFTVATGDGVLRILEVQPEGKKRMSAHDFMLGYKVSEGESLWQ